MITKELALATLEEYLLEEKLDEKAKSTRRHYRHVLGIFIEYLQDGEITKKQLMQFKEHLLDQYAPSTVCNYIVVTNKYIKYLEITQDDESSFESIKKHKSKNTVKNIKIQVRSSLEDILEPEDLKRMIRMAKKHDYEMYLIMKIFSYTGIRAKELEIFTVENMKSNYIQVRNKGKIRNAILRQDLKKELLQYCKGKNITTGYIFTGKKENTMLHASTVYKRLKKVAGRCRGISIDKVHPHSFRHLFAVKFMQEGGDITELADILGHASIETTRIYTRTTDKMKRKKLERMKY